MKENRVEFNQTVCSLINDLGNETEENFHFCDIRHEAVTGIDDRKRIFKEECSKELQNNRAGCTHGFYMRRLLGAYRFIEKITGNHHYTKVKTDIINLHEKALFNLDVQMRDINTVLLCHKTKYKASEYIGGSNYGINAQQILFNEEEAQSLKEELISTHRTHVKEILTLRDEVTLLLCQALFQDSLSLVQK